MHTSIHYIILIQTKRQKNHNAKTGSRLRFQSLNSINMKICLIT